MGTSLIKNRKNGASLKRLTSQMQLFVLELLADDEYNVAEAVRKAYPKMRNPGQYGHRLLKNPAIQAILGKAKREREERTQLTGDDIWRYLYTALFFNPFTLWKPCAGGGYMVERPEDIPEEVACLIESIEEQTIVEEDGSRLTRFKVVPISKSSVLAIAAKHAIPQDVNVRGTVAVLNLDSLSGRDNEPDPIQRRLTEERGKV